MRGADRSASVVRKFASLVALSSISLSGRSTRCHKVVHSPDEESRRIDDGGVRSFVYLDDGRTFLPEPQLMKENHTRI